ncbi:hypothetical protein L484_000194 [Morus notabilis]|uniref:BHLH domain-containing protein n=1 Tax=Morus notabilis TaxID=981085 RepID=W9SFU0_9ROSA|nr:hypothetical protein L484_000194 [Morus notabilis]
MHYAAADSATFRRVYTLHNSPSFALEAFDELWLLEDHSSTVAPTYTEINHLNPWRDLDFSPHLEQGISVLAEESNNIENDGSRGNRFSTLIESSSTEPNMFGEQCSDTLQNNTCTSRVEKDLNANTFTGQERSIVADYLSTSVRKGFSSKKRERKSKIKHVETERSRELVENEVEEQSLAKKQDHNAKERVRRMKLHASYLALGSLLPISGTSKVNT